MERKILLACFLSVTCYNLSALSWHTGHLVVGVTDKQGRPATNAVVCVRTLKRHYVGVGGREGDYETTRQQTGTNGVADVAFSFWDPDFDWYVETPSHHSESARPRDESFEATVDPSDYLRFATNTVEGLRKYNELRALEAGGDLEALYAKFEPKSVMYSSNAIYRSVSFYPRINPSPMYMYGEEQVVLLPPTPLVVTSNGVDVAQYPVVGVDLKKCAVLPPYADPDDEEDGLAGEVEDFTITHNVVETNGVRTVFGTMDFAPGCGAYKCPLTGDESFPSTYAADRNAHYLAHIPYEYSLSIADNRYVACRPLLGKDEYMVLRTRVVTNSMGEVTSCHYSKIVGGVWMQKRRFKFVSTVFNPRPGDPNLEADIEANLATGKGADARWP